MKFTLPLIVVEDLEASKKFYGDILSQQVTLDLGDNVCFAGFAIQRNYEGLVGVKDFQVGPASNDHELYFEEEDFDAFIAHLDACGDIRYLHRAKEYPWGQRVVRFYDPDGHIIEVGESMESVFRRFAAEGMSVAEVAERTMHPVEFVKGCIG